MTEDRKIPEVLCPAGDFQRLKNAIEFGADAVYLAGKMFGMRTSPNNFSFDDMKKAVELCHQRGVKVYLTCNTVPRNDEADILPEFLRNVSECKVDALIISDVGTMFDAKKYAPDLKIHISTQAGITNYKTANTFF